MKRYLFIVLFLMLEFSFSQMIVPDTSKMSETDKMIWYKNEKKSPATAIFYSWFLPTVGHSYVGDWERGVMFKGLQIGSILGGIFFLEKDSSSSSELNGTIMLLTAPVFFLWEFYDVAKLAKNYNKELYKNLFGEKSGIKISLIPKQKNIKLN